MHSVHDDSRSNGTIFTRDVFGRPLQSLRVSVTDRCNLRCVYCMPEEDYAWIPREQTLELDEIDRIVDVFLDIGVERVRLTGGEPLLRHNLATLVARLAGKSRLRDLALTTNGVLLAHRALELKAAGLHRITVSLDTLDPSRFRALTRRDGLGHALAGLDAAVSLFENVKIDMVVVRGVNDDEILSMLSFARQLGAQLRYIEYMDVGGATHWSMERVMTRAQILDRLIDTFGTVEPMTGDPSAPAEQFRLSDGTVFGIISSTTQPFCRRCSRSRLTADGSWYQCLYARSGLDLGQRLRSGASDEELARLIRLAWERRADRGAEVRARTRTHAPFISLEELRKDPRLEMHTRGG